MKISIRTFLFSIFVVALSGCGGGGAGAPATDTPLSLDEIASSVRSLDISGASRIMLTGDKVTTANTDDAINAMAAGDAVTMDPNSIYKVTTDGRLVRVGVNDTSGNEIPRGSVTPTEIKEINVQFLLLTLQIQGGDGSSLSRDYLVHKGTGFAYDATGVIPQYRTKVEQSSGYLFSMVAINGSFDDPISSSSYRTVFKIDINALGSSSLTATAVQNIDHLSTFKVDSSGKFMIYQGASRADPTSKSFRYLNLTTGAIANVPSSFGSGLTVKNLHAIKGLNGQLYINKTYTDPSSGSREHRVSRAGQDSNGNLIQSDIGAWTVTRASDGAALSPDTWGQHATNINAKAYIVAGKHIFLNGCEFDTDRCTSYSGTFTVSPEQATILEHDVPKSLVTIRKAQVSSNYIFYFGTQSSTGNDVILRYNPATYATKIFTAGSNIDINRYRVLSTDVIWFDGTRLSDQANIIGEIADDGTVTITDTVAGTEPPVINMEAITPADFIFINGDYQDWGTDLRIKTDPASDATAGHDLTFYSQTQSSSQYFGLVEFNNDSITTTNAATVINIDNKYELRIEENSGTFTTIGGATVDLRSTGALYSIGKAVEFSVPLSQLSGATFTSLAISRVTKELFGDVSAVVAPKNVSDFEVDITMATPLGDAEVIIALVGNYTLRFTKNTAVINDGTTDTNVVDIAGASITYPGTDGDNITAVIPETAIGSPGSITPTEESTPQTLDVAQDVM